MMSKTRPIGVFDSGVGGLTVVREIQRALPHEHIIYFGDTARVPYGNKSKDTVTKFAVENVEFLLRHNVKMVVVACNTASSLSLPFLKKCFKIPIVGVIAPGALCAAKVTRNKKIGVVGTKATVESAAYAKVIRKLDPKMSIFSKACPLFVPLIEEGWLKNGVAHSVAAVYLKGLLSKHVDTLILGCTHYPLLKPLIRRVTKGRIHIVDSAREVAREVKSVLERERLLNDGRKKPRYRFYVSDDPGRFTKLGKRFLRMNISCAIRS